MTLGLNHNDAALENVKELNSFGAANESSLVPLLNSIRLKMLNENVDRAKEAVKNILETENQASFTRKISVALGKYYDSSKELLILPPDLIQMINETRANPELTPMISILEEIGLFENKTTFTKDEKIAMTENASQVSQRLNKKLQYGHDKALEIKELSDNLIQLLRAVIKQEENSKSPFGRRVGGGH